MTLALKPSDFLRMQLTENGHALAKAREDVALLARLNAAAAEVTRLTKEGDKLTGLLHKALTDEERDSRKRTIGCVRNLRIVDDTSLALLDPQRFTVHCEMPAWSMEDNETVWTAKQFGLVDIPAAVNFVIMEDPAKHLPPSILALADNPSQALDEFFMAKQRGFARR